MANKKAPVKKVPAKRRGAPTTYTKALGQKVCKLIAEGYSVIKISKMPGLPKETTVYAWLQRHDEFAKEYARAREIQADFYADAINDLVSQPPPRTLDGRVDGAHVQYMRLQVDTKKWTASKLAPKRYGDKVAVVGDNDQPIQHLVRYQIDKPDDK